MESRFDLIESSFEHVIYGIVSLNLLFSKLGDSRNRPDSRTAAKVEPGKSVGRRQAPAIVLRAHGQRSENLQPEDRGENFRKRRDHRRKRRTGASAAALVASGRRQTARSQNHSVVSYRL